MVRRVADSGSALTLYDQIRRDILTGVFPPETELLETALAERYGVSRTPVREALARIGHDALVERVGRGYRVRSGTEDDVLEIYEARIALESAAAASAASRCTDLDLAKLRRLHRLAAQENDPDQVRALNSDWHALLWRTSGNKTIESLLDRLTTQLRIYDRGTRETTAELGETDEIHELVMDALERHDADEARRLIVDHLNHSRAIRLRRFAEDARVDR